MTAVKFIEEDGEWFIEGLILPYGGPTANGNDLTGSHFTKSTDFCLDWFPDGGRPGLYAHGFDASLGTSVIGREVKSWADDKGVWLRAQIDKAHEYAAEVKELVDRGVVALSSGAVDHLTRISAKSGEIARWPWVEWSLVPNPANPEALLYPVKSVDAAEHLTTVGAGLPAGAAVKDYPAWDAATAAQTISTLASLLGSCSDEAMCSQLRGAIDSLTAYMTASVSAIGTDDDDMAMRSVKSALTPQALHDAACASGATCAGDTTKDAPAPLLAIAGKHAETAPSVDLDALRSDLSALAVKTARELLRT